MRLAPDLPLGSQRLYRAARDLLAPDAVSAQIAYAETLSTHVRPGCCWLDLGCGRRLLPEWMEDRRAELLERAGTVVGVDPEVGSLRRNGDVARRAAAVGRLPFADAAFDLVTANMVLEHLRDPRREFAEVRRVLKPRGRFLFVTPNVRGYSVRLAARVPQRMRALVVRLVEKRDPDDRFETHYRANSRERIATLAEATGLEVETCRPVLSSAQFARVLPLALIELVVLRLVSAPARAELRPDVVGVLRKPSAVPTEEPLAGAADGTRDARVTDGSSFSGVPASGDGRGPPRPGGPRHR